MPVSAICNNSYTNDKGKVVKCQQVEPVMDPTTEKVFCPNCNSELVVNHFTKITMKNIKQFRQKPTIPFCIKCQNCSTENQPKIINDKIVCPKCLKEHTHLTKEFKIMLKLQLKTVNKDV